VRKVLSVNVSLPKEVPYRGKTITTSVFKEPVEGRVTLRSSNLDGDGQADLSVHGGVHKGPTCTPSRTTSTGSANLVGAISASDSSGKTSPSREC
jgi:MOSC domain-containing protein YiiM